MLIATNGPLRRLPKVCSARATSSFPVPDSPVIITVKSVVINRARTQEPYYRLPAWRASGQLVASFPHKQIATYLRLWSHICLLGLERSFNHICQFVEVKGLGQIIKGTLFLSL